MGGGKRKKYDARKKMDLEEFEEEIEQDKYLRKHINLYRDEAAIKAKEDRRQKKQEKQNKPKEEEMKDEKKDDEDSEWETDSEEYEENNKEMVHLEELFKDMALDEKDEEASDDDIDALIGDMEAIKVKK